MDKKKLTATPKQHVFFSGGGVFLFFMFFYFRIYDQTNAYKNKKVYFGLLEIFVGSLSIFREIKNKNVFDIEQLTKNVIFPYQKVTR